MTRASRMAMRVGSVALSLVILAFLASAIPFRQIIDQRERLEQAQAELAGIEAENELLALEVAALNTPEEIERMAREKLGYVMPGEIAFVVLDPSTPTTAPVVEAYPPAAPWWQRIWSFLTGADLDE